MIRPRIVRDREIMHGQPVIEGTRWPTETVVGWDFDRAAILDAYPHQTPEEVDVAIRYERSLLRRLGRAAWRIRYRLAAWLIGMDAETLREDVG